MLRPVTYHRQSASIHAGFKDTNGPLWCWAGPCECGAFFNVPRLPLTGRNAHSTFITVPLMQRHFQQANTKRATGFSLFELLIVMTIIVTITAMAAPNMMERVRNGRVQEAAEDVREVLAFARQQAIDSGVDYHVRYEVDGQAVVAIPSEPQPTLVNQAGSNSSQAQVLVMSLVLEPEKMFLRAMKGENAGGEQLEPAVFANLDGNEGLSSRSWSAPILFRFDGSAEDRTFRLMDEENRTSEISVRGLTGAIKVAPVFMMEAD